MSAQAAELMAGLGIVRTLRRTLRTPGLGPARLMLVLNKACDSRCRYCQIWRENRPGTLSLTEYELLARSVPQLTWLSLTGGEPMLQQDLLEIVNVFRQSCPELSLVNLTTNGLHAKRTLEVVEQLRAQGPAIVYVNVSIDGPPETHDRLRGIEGNFDQAVALLRELRQRPWTRSGVSYTLVPENYHLLDETLALIQKAVPCFRRSELSLNLAQASSHYYGNTRQRHQNLILLEQVLRRELKHVALLGNGGLGLLKSAYLREAINYVTRGETGVACGALQTSVYVSESGEVYPCHTWDRSLGKLSEYGFRLDDLLRSAEAARTLQEVRQKKCPGCWSPCQAYPSLLAQPVALLTHA